MMIGQEDVKKDGCNKVRSLTEVLHVNTVSADTLVLCVVNI